MDAAEVGRAWDANASTWIELSRAGYDVYRDACNTPAFLAMLPDVAGLMGLDVGCGEGHNTRQVAARGASMVGVDISAEMIGAARHDEGSERALDVVRADARALPFPAASFDFAVAFMSLMDMPDPDRVLVEVARVVRPGGFVQLSLTHPCTDVMARVQAQTAAPPEGPAGPTTARSYFDTAPHTERWLFQGANEATGARHEPFVVPRFPLTLAAWINGISAAGFALEQAGEPRASEEAVAAHPELADTRVAPYFLHLRARRPARS